MRLLRDLDETTYDVLQKRMASPLSGVTKRSLPLPRLVEAPFAPARAHLCGPPQKQRRILGVGIDCTTLSADPQSRLLCATLGRGASRPLSRLIRIGSSSSPLRLRLPSGGTMSPPPTIRALKEASCNPDHYGVARRHGGAMPLFRNLIISRGSDTLYRSGVGMSEQQWFGRR